MQYSVSTNNIHIVDSAFIEKKYFDRCLGEIQSSHPECEVWNRSYFSLKMEWAAHNFLYSLGIQKDRTKDVDLDYPQKWYMRIGYTVGGLLSWIFIK